MAEGGAGERPPRAPLERLVLKSAAEHHYLRVSLEFPDGGARLNAAHFKQLVVSALKELHGEWPCQTVECFNFIGLIPEPKVCLQSGADISIPARVIWEQ